MSLHWKVCEAAHYKCNLRYKRPKILPVVFQNLSRYDSHLFIRKRAGYKLFQSGEEKEEKIDCIPTMRKNISYSLKMLILISFIPKGEEKVGDVKFEI